MKYYIIVGEASGDLHASNLMKEIRQLDAAAEFRFWGGDLMAAQGGEMVRHYKETAVMGIIDVVLSAGKIRRNFALCRRDLLAYLPDALILVDYAGFNLPMAKFAKKHGIRTLFYIAPKTWASKEYRVGKIRRDVDELYSIMPFEADYFARHGVVAHYCGNPVMDAVEARRGRTTFEEFVTKNALDNRPKIALLAGSRRSELKYNLPEMLKAVRQFADYQFVIAGAPSFTTADYEPYIAGHDVRVVFNQTYELLEQSRLAIVTSGTATLETAVLGCPQIVIYRMWGGRFSHVVAKMLIKVPFISLVNLILGREAVVELFQSNYNFGRMKKLMTQLLVDGPERKKMLDDYAELQQKVGGSGCSARAAKMMIKYLTEKDN